ncbi:MAG: RagB/SusD family nutrient uptake outer membrane protein, partial [Dysgonamonadaceae bacterium]|nr:RagB/SusD family nutrient uptake outer membrane protein [Dysgonamonadaceae bacterium]
MKTQKYSLFILLAGLLGFLEVSCDDVIQYEQPAVTMLSDAFNTPTDAIASATASYVPLMWELGMTYAPEWWIGDVCSDDALKGGENLSDMSSVYDMENFKTRSDNDVLLTFYRIQYMGAYRCNVAIENVGTMKPEIFKEDPSIQKRVLGEVLFLRALYHFRLVRIFGGVPLADRILRLQSEWKQPRATEAETYEMIYKDLKLAIQYLPEKSKYAPADLGRATKGAARALLMKAYMNNHLYEEAKLQGDSIINSGEYSLVADYNEQFTVEGENGRESIFETQYIAEGSSAYEGNDGQLGYARGTFTVVMTRPRWTNAPFGG